MNLKSKTDPFEKLIFDGFSLDNINEAVEYALSSEAFRVGVRISP